MNKVNITSVGSVETYENNKKIPKYSSFEWNGNYDGKTANIDIRIDNNGKKNKSKIQLTNDELIKMLSGPVDSSPIDERLMNDFLSDRNVTLHPSIMLSHQKKNVMPMMFVEHLEPLSTANSSKTKKRRNRLKQHKNKSNKQKNKRKMK
jgi:hypothetical protein